MSENVNETPKTEEKEKPKQSENKDMEDLLDLLKSATNSESDEKIKDIEKKLDDNFLSKLESALKEAQKTNPNIINELKTAIESIPDFNKDGTNINKLYKIYKKVYNIKNDSDKKENNEKEWWNDSKENKDISLKELELTEESIKRFFSRHLINKNQIIEFFNDKKNNNEISKENENLLRLMYKWLTEEWNKDPKSEANAAIRELQRELEVNVDWKFGIKTFNALREKFWEEPIKKKFSEKSAAVEPNQQQNTEVENSWLDLRISNNLEEVEVDYSDKEYFWLPDNTEIFKRDSYTGYYYRNGDSLYYIPNMINRNNSDHDCDKKPLIRKTSNWEQWENLYPTNSKNFSKYLQYTLSLADRDAKIVFDDNARSYKIEKNGLSVNIISKTLESWYFSKKDNFNMRLQGDLYLLSLSLDIQNAINNKNI